MQIFIKTPHKDKKELLEIIHSIIPYLFEIKIRFWFVRQIV